MADLGLADCVEENLLNGSRDSTNVQSAMLDDDSIEQDISACSASPQLSAKPSSFEIGDPVDRKAYALRSEKVRRAKIQYEQERKRRVQELLEAQRQADEKRKRQEEERRNRIEEARRRDTARRRTVEQRRRQLEQADLERKEVLMKRLSDRELRADSARSERRGRSGLVFAFGSSTPREISSSRPDLSAVSEQSKAASGEKQRNTKSAVSSSRILSKSTVCINSLASSSDAAGTPAVSGDKRDAQQVSSAVSSVDICSVSSSSSRTPRTRIKPRPSSNHAGKKDTDNHKTSARQIKIDEDQKYQNSQTKQSSVVKAGGHKKDSSPKSSPRMTASVTEDSLRSLSQPKRNRASETKHRIPAASAKGPASSSKASLMTKSMIDLPSTKKGESDSGKSQSNAAVASPRKMHPRQPKLPSTAEVTPHVPKSHSANDLKLNSAPAKQQPDENLELRDTKQVTVAEILPNIDASEAKRKFEEQRRLHRERLRAEREAEEARKAKDEEFRQRRSEELRRREQEAQQREEQERKESETEQLRLQQLKEAEAAKAELEQKEAEAAARDAREREELERQKKLQAEEEARLERRRKLEAIMHRVKTGGQSGSPTPDKQVQQNNQEERVPQEPMIELEEASAAAADKENKVNNMAISMPPEALSQELNNSSGGITAMAALAGRLKGTKAAEILARHSSSQQNLSEGLSPERKLHQQPLVTESEKMNSTESGNHCNSMDEEEVDQPALLTSNIETRLAEVRARLYTTDCTSDQLEQVIQLPDKDDNSESGVSSPGTHCVPEFSAQQQQQENGQQANQNDEQSLIPL